MKNVDKKIETLLEMDIVGDDNKVTFSQEAKDIIHEIAEECKAIELVKSNEDKAETYGVGLSAEEVYVDMLYKIVNAPTTFHRIATPRLMIPIIDQKLQEGGNGIER